MVLLEKFHELGDVGILQIPYTSCVYLPAFGWYLRHMLINIPYMEHMGTIVNILFFVCILLICYYVSLISITIYIYIYRMGYRPDAADPPFMGGGLEGSEM